VPGFVWGWGTGWKVLPQRKPVPQPRVGGFDPDSNSTRKRGQWVSMLSAGISNTLGNGHSCLISSVSTFILHHHHLCPSYLDIPTTTEAQKSTRQDSGTGRMGVLHPFSQQGTYFFYIDHGTSPNYHFYYLQTLLGHLGQPTTIKVLVFDCFSLPPPIHLRKRANALVFNGKYLFVITTLQLPLKTSQHGQNRACLLVFEGGYLIFIITAQPPSKTSAYAHFRWWLVY